METTTWDHEPQPYERGDRWGVIHSWITRAGLSHRAITAYVALCLHVDRAGYAWPSIATMAEEMSTSPQTIRRGLVELEERGIIIRQARYRDGARLSDYIWVRQQAPRGLVPAQHATDEHGTPIAITPADEDAATIVAHPPTTSTPGTTTSTPGTITVASGTTTVVDEHSQEHSQEHSGGARARERASADTHDATTAPAEAVAPPQPDEAEIIDEAPDAADPLQALIPSSGGTRPSRDLIPTVAPTTTSRRATRLPDDWRPSEALVAWTIREAPGLDHERELARFRDYWHSAAGARGRKTSWDATWRNWIRRAVDDARRCGGQPQRRPESVLPDRLPIDHMTEDDWRDFAHYVNSSPDLLAIEAEERAHAQGALPPIPGIDPRGWLAQ